MTMSIDDDGADLSARNMEERNERNVGNRRWPRTCGKKELKGQTRSCIPSPQEVEEEDLEDRTGQ